MARRTKEEALATRHKLLDAAEHLFQVQGVSRTSLQDIARRAGATRGAVYWHFKDKADLFNAMMERVTLPLEESFNHENKLHENLGESQLNAIERIRHSTVNALHQIVTDAQTRRVFEVATQKVEYVEELQAVRLRHLTVRKGFLDRIQQGMETAAAQMNLKLPVSASTAAQGLHALIDGLIQNWLLDPEAFDLLEVGQCAIDVYLRGMGFPGDQQAVAACAGPAQAV
ncbi:transcriptional regulator, TetR family [Polaromonas sp. YR568]|uniref:TetR family transcriptional regulator n=1 Tax=Polaromonas sp. YR568 TaxID=1855301 RepID=UPI0008F2DFBC|nr:TetR family transcriptional regulator [Polaromonas sp. YR568]SFU55680.1 transcriptional regulator, TetR family [Polaromonas sp. YR568]